MYMNAEKRQRSPTPPDDKPQKRVKSALGHSVTTNQMEVDIDFIKTESTALSIEEKNSCGSCNKYKRPMWFMSLNSRNDSVGHCATCRILEDAHKLHKARAGADKLYICANNTLSHLYKMILKHLFRWKNQVEWYRKEKDSVPDEAALIRLAKEMVDFIIFEFHDFPDKKPQFYGKFMHRDECTAVDNIRPVSPETVATVVSLSRHVRQASLDRESSPEQPNSRPSRPSHADDDSSPHPSQSTQSQPGPSSSRTSSSFRKPSSPRTIAMRRPDSTEVMFPHHRPFSGRVRPSHPCMEHHRLYCDDCDPDQPFL